MITSPCFLREAVTAWLHLNMADLAGLPRLMRLEPFFSFNLQLLLSCQFTIGAWLPADSTPPASLYLTLLCNHILHCRRNGSTVKNMTKSVETGLIARVKAGLL